MRYVARVITSLWIVLSASSPIYGQIYKYVGIDDGLSSRNVYAVLQSNDGFMWCLTDMGIDRYDGTEVNRYTLTINGVKFTEYSSCRFRYDRTTDNLWLITSGGKVIQYVRRNNNFEVMYSPDIQYRRSDIIRCVASPIDSEGNLWLLVGEQAFRYNVYTNEGHEMTLLCKDSDIAFATIASVGDSTLYIGAKGGVYRGIVSKEAIEVLPIPELQHTRINVNTFYYSEAFKTLLIGTEDAGILAYRESTGELIHHKDLLPDVRVTRIIPYSDDTEVLFSTNAACVFRMALDDCVPQRYLSAD